MRKLLFGLAAMLLPQVASATTYNIRVCFKIDSDFDDAALAGSRLTNNAFDYPASGIKIRVRDHDTNTDLYNGATYWIGAYEGCTTTLAMDSTHDHSISYWPDATVGNNDVNIEWNLAGSWTTTQMTIAENSYNPTASGTRTYTIAGPVPNTLLAATNALKWADGGLTGKTFKFRVDPTNGLGNGNQWQTASGGMVYLATGTNTKYRIVETMGFYIPFFLDGGVEQSFNWFASNTSCRSAGVASAYNEKEYTDAAAWYGFMMFYAAVAYNSVSQDGCEYGLITNDIDWSLNGAYGDDNETAPMSFDCEAAPASGIGGTQYMEVECASSTSNRGVPYDWLRFYWDLRTNTGYDVPFNDIAAIWQEADPSSWRDSDAGSAPLPYGELEAAATTLGWYTEWNGMATANGVDH